MGDNQEFTITRDNTALIPTYHTIPWNLTEIGGDKIGRLFENTFKRSTSRPANSSLEGMLPPILASMSITTPFQKILAGTKTLRGITLISTPSRKMRVATI